MKNKGFENLLLAVPKSNTIAGVNVDKLEQLNEENFLLTYEINKEEKIKALNSNHSVFLKGTNYTYPYITGYSVVKGSFFTQLAQKQKNKSVVLNELAAFELFGSYDIVGNNVFWDSEPYTIVGVISDEDKENKNIYVPITLLSDKPTTFLTFIDSDNGVSEEYIKNEFKEANVTDTSHDFINFKEITRVIQEQAIVTILSAICVIIVSTFKSNIKKFMDSYKAFKDLLMQCYFKDILQSKPDNLYSLLRRSFYIVFCICSLSIIAYNIFKMCINWNMDINTLIGLMGGVRPLGLTGK
ncbi:ABC transporter permease [Clostridium sp. BSD9I1]|uniref:ABC transporter permease n=1 Tax=Clostridium sp. BSD9I1 TaxID=2003589 RepID=UPI001FA916A5